MKNKGQFAEEDSDLQAYLQAKIGLADCVEQQKLTDAFFKTAYGAGGQDMKKFYLSYREQAKKIQAECYGTPLHCKFWDEKLLNEWLDYTKTAFEKITPLLQLDILRYVAYAKNIVAERIFVKYLLLELYSDSYTETDLERLKRSVKTDCEWLEFSDGNKKECFSLWILWGIDK